MRIAVLILCLVGCGRYGFGETTTSSADAAASDGASTDSIMSCTSGDCTSLVVPGGSFFRSYDGVGNNNMGYPATVSAFRLDKYEVTVARFRQFLEAGYGTQANPPASGAGARMLGAVMTGGWDPSWNTKLVSDTNALRIAVTCFGHPTWTDTPAGNEDRPMNCIDWYEAMAFCIWDGGFLPTEAEWNFAAAGGNEQRAFPWSNPPSSLTIDDTYASYSPDNGTTCNADGIPACAVTDLLPVGSRPAGDARWGHSDMGGNVWEWVLDWYVTPYASASCTDCVNLTNTTGYQVERGGSYNYQPAGLRTSARAYDPDGPPDHDATSGVRCARPI